MANLNERTDHVWNSFPLIFCIISSNFCFLHKAVNHHPLATIKQYDKRISWLLLQIKHLNVVLNTHKTLLSCNESMCIELLDDAIEQEQKSLTSSMDWTKGEFCEQDNIKRKISEMKDKLHNATETCTAMTATEKISSETQIQLNQLNIGDINADNITAITKFKGNWPNKHPSLWYINGLSFLNEYNGMVICVINHNQTTRDHIINKYGEILDGFFRELKENRGFYTEIACLLNDPNPGYDVCSCLDIIKKGYIPNYRCCNEKCGRYMIDSLVLLRNEVIVPLKLGKLNAIKFECKHAWDYLSMIHKAIASIHTTHILQSTTEYKEFINDDNDDISHPDDTHTNNQPEPPIISNVKRSHGVMDNDGNYKHRTDNKINHHTSTSQLQMNPSTRHRTD